MPTTCKTCHESIGIERIPEEEAFDTIGEDILVQAKVCYPYLAQQADGEPETTPPPRPNRPAFDVIVLIRSNEELEAVLYQPSKSRDPRESCLVHGAACKDVKRAMEGLLERLKAKKSESGGTS